MVGVNLADMLRSLYWIPCKTKRWYQKTFWHLIHMAKINAWLLYRPHFHWNEKTHKDQKSMLQFSLDLSEALIFANKVNPSSSKERSPERWSSEAPTTGKSLLKHCLSPVFVLAKSHICQALLPTKIDADYAVWPAECSASHTRPFSVHWLIATVLLISMQNHRK